jgi:copper chaperone CopZ
MVHQYQITGMTCGNCVAKVRSAMLMVPFVTEVEDF